MPFDCELRFRAECEDCGRRHEVTHDGTEFGLYVEPGDEIIEFFYDLEFNHGWELRRVSYEEHEFRCPTCKAKREAA